MTCHSCPHAEAILRGDHDSTPWEELPCSTCKLGEDTFYSVPFDEEHPPSCTAGVSPAPDNCELLTDNSLLPAATLADFVKGLLSLPPELRDVVSLRFQGLQYKEIAQLQGTTTQCAEMRHKRAMREWPVLESLFPYTVACRNYRRSRKTGQKSCQ